MDQPFRLALVGAGLIVQNSHLPAALACPEVEVAAIVDPVKERAASLAKTYGISPKITSSIEEVASDLDGALIATPNHTHRDLALQCISAGLSVLIEKPLANTRKEGLEIVQAAEKTGSTLALGYCQRFWPNMELLKALLDCSFFGKVQRFVHQFGTAGGWSPLSAYNLERKTAGGGVLVVTGSHFLDLLLNFWGYPDHVELLDDGFNGPEANCHASFKWDNKSNMMTGIARYSKTGRLPGGLVIETDRGVVMIGGSIDADIRFRERGTWQFEQILRKPDVPQKEVDPFLLQLRDFVGASRDRRAPRVDGRQALESLRLIEALYANRRLLKETWYEQGEVA